MKREVHFLYGLLGERAVAVHHGQPSALHQRIHRYPRKTRTGSTLNRERTDTREASRQHSNVMPTRPAKTAPVIWSGMGVELDRYAAQQKPAVPRPTPPAPNARPWISTTD